MTTEASPFVIKEDITIGVRKSLMRLFQTPEEAVYELVDNSMAAMVNGNMLEVRIRTNKQQKQFEIVDCGGTGFTKESLEKFPVWGEASEGKVTRFYNIGGKAAMGYLGEGFTLYTQSIEGKLYTIQVANWRSHNEYLNIPVKEEAPNFNKPLTSIRIQQVDRMPSTEKLKHSLSIIYPILMREGRLRIWVNSNAIQPVQYPATDIIGFEKHLSFGTLKGWAGIKTNGDIRGGIRCYLENRLILTKEREFFDFNRPGVDIDELIGEIYMPMLPFEPIKRGIDEGSPEWLEVKAVTRSSIEPLVKRLHLKPAPRNPKLEKELTDFINKVIRVVYQEALELGRKPPTLEHPLTKKERKEIKKEIKKIEGGLAPPDAIGDLLRGGMKVELRHLGEGRIRAQVKEKVAYINIDHPLYKIMQRQTPKKALGAYSAEAVISELALNRIFDTKEYKDIIDSVIWESIRD